MNTVHEASLADPPEISFSTLRVGPRYSRSEVDAFISQMENHLAAAIANGKQDVTAAQLRNMQFGEPAAMRRGYDRQEVDTFLHVLAEELQRQHNNGS